MKKAFIGDLHFGVKGGDKNFLEFQVNYLKKKLDLMASWGIKTLYQLGDSFDNRKQTQSTVQQGMIDVIEHADKLGIHIVFLVGNHNTFYTDRNDIHNLKTFEKYPNVTIVTEFAEIDDFLVLGWINRTNSEQIEAAVAASTKKYCLMHAEFTGFDMYNGIKAKGGSSVVPYRKFDKVLTGHYHTVSTDGNVTYVGSPYALTWMDFVDGDNRGFWVLDDVSGEFSLIKNEKFETLFFEHDYNPEHDYSSADFANYTGKILKFHVKEVEDQAHYDKFVALLNSVLYIDRRIIDHRILSKVDHNTIDVTDMHITPLLVIQDYVKAEALENGLDIENAVSLATELYTNASSGETK